MQNLPLDKFIRKCEGMNPLTRYKMQRQYLGYAEHEPQFVTLEAALTKIKTLKGWITTTTEISELRISKYRIMIAHLGYNEYVLLSVFRKSTKRTPTHEIRKAENRLKRFRNY